MFRTEYVDDFTEFYANNKEHMQKHYNDFAETFNGTRELNIDVNLFQHLIDLGHANIFTLWEDSTFLGYVSITISPSVLFRGTVDAVIDHFYLIEEYRGKGYANLVIAQIEEQLKSDGVDYLTIGLPTLKKYEGFAKSLGFNKHSCVHVKNLGDNNGS